VPRSVIPRVVAVLVISEEADERRQNPARFRSVKSLNGLAELFGHRRRFFALYSCRNATTGFSREARNVGGSAANKHTNIKPSSGKTTVAA
jgi:hypothetical protein